MFATATGLVIEGDWSTAADDLSEALDWYVVDARIQSSINERSTAPEWGNVVAEWAADGLTLLGGTGGQDASLAQACAHLSDALASEGLPEEADLLRYVLKAREQHVGGSADGVDEDRGSLQRQTAAFLLEEAVFALRALHILGKRVGVNRILKGKQVDRARLNLIVVFARVFAQLFPTAPFNIHTRIRSKARLSERRVFSDGPALRWCQAILTSAPDSLIKVPGDPLPEIIELRKWATKPDGLSKVIRKLNAKPLAKSD